MKKIDCIFYLVDTNLYLYNLKKEELKDYSFTNYLFEGRIIKPKAFIKKLNDILKEEKISKILTGQSTIILYEPHLKYIDKKIIIDSFDQCNFKDIKLVNTKELVKENTVEINNHYLIHYHRKSYEMIRFNTYFSLETILKIMKKKNDKPMYFIGISEKVEELAQKFKNTYYYENKNTFYIDKIKEKLAKNG